MDKIKRIITSDAVFIVSSLMIVVAVQRYVELIG